MKSPFKKAKGEDKLFLLSPKSSKKTNDVPSLERSMSSICKQLKNSVVKECFIDLFSKEREDETSPPKKFSPYLKNISIGSIKLCEDTTHLIDINYFEKKLETALNQMGLMGDEELAEYSLDVGIMHCMNINFHLNEGNPNNPYKHMIRTNLMAKYTTTKRSNGKTSCELWYQGRGEKEVVEVDDKVKRETLEMAYDDNLSYILDMMRANQF